MRVAAWAFLTKKIHSLGAISDRGSKEEKNARALSASVLKEVEGEGKEEEELADRAGERGTSSLAASSATKGGKRTCTCKFSLK